MGPLYLRDILSAYEASALVDLSETLGYESAYIATEPDGPRGFRAPHGRNNSRAVIEDATIAALIWSRIRRHIAPLDGCVPLGLNERLRYYRYDPGQSFAPHTDGYFADARGRSKLTLLLYLNDAFTGGETCFGATSERFAPETGAALLFAHELWHESRPLLSGRKYVMRTDVMFSSVPTSPARS